MPAFLAWTLGLIGAAAALAAAFYAALPWVVQPLLRAALWPRYRLQVIGREHVPRSGPVLLAANHVSWLDGFLLAATAPRRGKALVSADIIGRPPLRALAVRSGMIPTPFSGPKAIRAAIETTRRVLDEGDGIAMFPEGQLSRNGLTGPFYRGIEVILRDRPGVAVVPVGIDNVWGSLFSFSEGRFFKKWPKGWRRTITLVYAPPVPHPVTAFTLRQRLMEAVVHAAALRPGPRTLPETIDLSLPHWRHPVLGLLTASCPDYEAPGIRQAGTKPGTVGLIVPGVALRVLDDSGRELGPDEEGKIEALVAGRDGWEDTGARGSLHADGFVSLA